jgi:hypothetical protein
MAQKFYSNTRVDFIGEIARGQHLHILVQDAVNAIFIARDRNILETPVVAQSRGLKLLASNGPVEIAWAGEAWVIANAASVACEVSIE